MSQLADLAPLRRSATLIAFTHTLTRSARDDVIDVFDVAFGDLQRSAKNRGQKRRAGELRDYDRAVAEVQEAMQTIFNALDDPNAIDDALQDLRDDRERLDDAMGTVTALMRSPSDPFHDRLVASYPQIRRFLPKLIEAIKFESTESTGPILEALDALGVWLEQKPRTTRLPDTDVPMDVVDNSWEPTYTTATTGPSTDPRTPVAPWIGSEHGLGAGISTVETVSDGATHILNYCNDPIYRRDIQRILNRGETRNGLSRDVFHGQLGQLGRLRQRYQAGQENHLGALGLMVNIIVLWNTIYTQAALDHLTDGGHEIDPTDVARLSPLGHPTINLQGRYQITNRPPANTLRPLRTHG